MLEAILKTDRRSARWKTRGRGTGYGVPGYGVAGCGKRRVWKTRGLVKNAGSGGKRGVPFFSPKYEFSSVK